MKHFINIKNLVLCLAPVLLMAFAVGCDDDGAKAQDADVVFSLVTRGSTCDSEEIALQATCPSNAVPVRHTCDSDTQMDVIDQNDIDTVISGTKAPQAECVFSCTPSQQANVSITILCAGP